MFGVDLGNIVTWSVCGWLIEKWGWQWAFFIPSACTGVFVLVWYFLAFETPAKHPRILPTERKYIEDSLTNIVMTGPKTWPPIWKILTSVPFLALSVLFFGHSWGSYFIQTAAPKFMHDVLGFDIASSGLMSSLPYVLRIFTGIGFGILGDYLGSKNRLPNRWIRKGFTIFCRCAFTRLI